jgi:hypothetical protein
MQRDREDMSEPIEDLVEGGIYFPGAGTQVHILNFADRAKLIPIGLPRPTRHYETR